uniref:Reverse transcriptase domain-containing protein n=1 Tax=Megaselia scalaris TaxID=36166 RepID=T1GAT0_MEGSC
MVTSLCDESVKNSSANCDKSRMTPQKESLDFNCNEDIPSLTTEEVRNIIQRFKYNKSAGSDGIPAEVLKSAGINFIDSFHELLVKI